MRVAIIGNAGGGKSRLARAMADQFDAPLLELDRLLWQPGWVATPASEFEASHRAWLQRSDWIIDGVGPWASAQERLVAADWVIFVDLPFHVHLWWATKRQITSLFRVRSDGPEGCPMWKVTFRLYPMMVWMQRHMRPKILADLAVPSKGRRVSRIKSVEALNHFLRD